MESCTPADFNVSATPLRAIRHAMFLYLQYVYTYTVSVVSGCLMLLLCVAFLLSSCCLPVASLVVPVCLTTTVDAANSQFHTMAHPGAANPDTGRAHRAAMWDRAAMCFGEFMRTM